MKTTTQVLLCAILCIAFLPTQAQTETMNNIPGQIINPSEPRFPDDELLVSYFPGTPENVKQLVRNRYNITVHIDINGTLEVWDEISFPLQVEDGDNLPATLYDIGDMLFDLNLQNNINADDNDARAQINGGDYNYHLALPGSSTSSYPNVPDFILPACQASYNRLIGSVGAANTNSTPIIIIDQNFASPENNDTSGTATTHADKVASVIHNTVGVVSDDYYVANIPIFDTYGRSNYAKIIQAFKWLEDTEITDGIINLSASMPVYSNDFSEAIRTYIDQVLNDNNLLLVSSAGNEGLSEEVRIFPGGDFFANEITVAGTQDCFGTPWIQTNSNRFFFEIAAEATNVVVPLTHSTPNRQETLGLESGTSYSAPMVSGALAQLATHYTNFDAQTLKTRLLDRADQIPALSTTVQLGRVLNTSSATDFSQSLIGHASNGPHTNATSFDLAAPAVSELSAYPNPFRQWIKLQVPTNMQGTPATLTISDQLGRVLYTEQFSELGSELQLQQAETGHFPAGPLWLLLENKQHAESLLLSKQ